MTMFSPSILHQYSIPFNKVTISAIVTDNVFEGSLCLLLLRLFRKRVTSWLPFHMAIMLALTMASIVRSPQILLLPVG